MVLPPMRPTLLMSPMEAMPCTTVQKIAGAIIIAALSAINVVVMTVLATVAAHLYNLAAQLLGGIEVTFRED